MIVFSYKAATRAGLDTGLDAHPGFVCPTDLDGYRIAPLKPRSCVSFHTAALRSLAGTLNYPQSRVLDDTAQGGFPGFRLSPKGSTPMFGNEAPRGD